MESPFSWTEAEKIIADVMERHEAVLAEDAKNGNFRCGLSLPMQIGNALREAGLLPPYEAPDQKELQVRPAPGNLV